jgi:hypothetical protein
MWYTNILYTKYIFIIMDFLKRCQQIYAIAQNSFTPDGGGRGHLLASNQIGLRRNIGTGPRVVEGAHENIAWRGGKVNCIKKNRSS